jgi:hypothetical protein
MTSSLITFAGPEPVEVPTPFPRPKTPAPFVVTTTGLRVSQVLRHVATLLNADDPLSALDHLVETAEVCGRLLALRRNLSIALKTHRRIDRLSQLAHGREQAQLMDAAEGDSLRSVAVSMQSCVDDVLAQWRCIGQTFTRLTRLLPTQIDHQHGLPRTLSLADHRELLARFVREQAGIPAARFEAAVDAYMGAHRRYQARLRPALAARERRHRAELEHRACGVTMKTLPLALFEDYLSRQALLAAEGDRAGAHYVLHLMVDAPALLRGPRQRP